MKYAGFRVIVGLEIFEGEVLCAYGDYWLNSGSDDEDVWGFNSQYRVIYQHQIEYRIIANNEMLIWMVTPYRFLVLDTPPAYITYVGANNELV